MLISVVTVVKNDLTRLKKTILSLKNIYNDSQFEHLIIDGLSDDKTSSFVKKLKQRKKNIIFLSSKDKGIYDAMNKGIEISNGDLLIFINAGDELIVNKRNLINKLNKFELLNTDVICFPFIHNFSGNKVLKFPNKKSKGKLPTSHQAMFFTKLFLQNRKFSLLYNVASDFDLYLKADPEKVFIISKFSPISVVELEGVASNNPSLSYTEYKKIVSSHFSGLFKLYLLLKVNLKYIIIIILKFVFSKNLIFKIRKLFYKF